MAVSGSQKAAMLLATLDANSAAQLLQSVRPETATEIAAELACIRSSGGDAAQQHSAAGEFCRMLLEGGASRDDEQFIRQVLKMSLGEDKFDNVFQDVQRRVKMRDPFAEIRSADVSDVAVAVKGESPQVIAIVLSELPSDKSAKLLLALDDQSRSAVVQAMVSGQSVLPEARLRVASLIEHRLGGGGEKSRAAARDSEEVVNAQARKTAVILRSMDVKLRETLIGALKERDKELAVKTVNMMVLWEDLPIIEDRALQEALRSADAGKLALALHETDESIAGKVRRNISERARTMLAEEQSLLSKPKPEEVNEARQSILKVLRDMNARGDLDFEESQS